ncbi:MAG: protealysin inhibitor emfourin [Cyanobacteria bacterium J06635_10]
MPFGHRSSDRFQYRVTVEDKDKQNTVTGDESSIPETLRIIVEWINYNG